MIQRYPTPARGHGHVWTSSGRGRAARFVHGDEADCLSDLRSTLRLEWGTARTGGQRTDRPYCSQSPRFRLENFSATVHEIHYSLVSAPHLPALSGCSKLIERV